MTWGIIFLLLFIVLLLLVGGPMLKASASQSGVDAGKFSILPNSVGSLFGLNSKRPAYVPVEDEIKNLKRGFDVNLVGAAESENEILTMRSATYAIKPKDFVGMSPIPKIIPEVGTQLKAGDPLFFDKKRPEVIYAAPVSGELIEVRRGEKRSINEIIILADKGEVTYRTYDNIPDLATASREQLVEFLANSGAWPFIRQRPFDVVASTTEAPKAIFVSTFDSAPLAPDLNLAIQGKEEAFNKGLELLTKLTTGTVHVGLNAKGKKAPAAAFTDINIEGVETHWFKGMHPAGNVGVQIHHTDPVLPGHKVWHLDIHGVILLGNLFLNGQFDTERMIAVVGSELPVPYNARVHQGVALDALLTDMGPDFEEATVLVRNEEGKKEEQTIQKRAIRIVSGDLLSGNQVERNSFLGFFDDQLSVVSEGDYFELFGWLLPQKGHPTISRTFPNGFFPGSEYVADTNTNGEQRAFVISGEYESVLPMNIYPQHVMRAIIAKDYEKMEGLGILELGEEDIAICEYVCTSKQPLQAMLREGLDELREQM